MVLISGIIFFFFASFDPELEKKLNKQCEDFKRKKNLKKYATILIKDV